MVSAIPVNTAERETFAVTRIKQSMQMLADGTKQFAFMDLEEPSQNVDTDLGVSARSRFPAVSKTFLCVS